ncbi:MAG: AMP-binding protein [Actinobacteria bacterium]|nr:AMP-binding protein [Actinomycetota bacterium]
MTSQARFGEPGTLDRRMFWDHVDAMPDALAVDDLTQRRTWAELADRTTRLAHLVRTGFGVAPGERVAAIMGNRVDYVELVLASLFGGVFTTAVNWHLTADEAAFILDDADARVVFTDAEHEAVAREAAGARPVVVVGHHLSDALDASSTERFPLDAPAGGTMFYTSGTTGRPKGVKRAVQSTVRDQLRAMDIAGTLLGLDGRGPHLVTGPLYHAAPLGFAVMDLMNGAPLIVMPRWDEQQALELIDQRDVRTTHLVPTMFVRLLRLPHGVREKHALDSLRVVLHGAAPVSEAVKRRMIDWWGPVLVEYWGASEGGVVTLVDSDDWLTHPGTVGRPTRSHEVFAADETGEVLPRGEVGQLWCKNLVQPAVFEYHDDPERTALAFREPGVYTIGDLGWVDDDGYVYLADRASNMIISGGVNIYPAEVEHVLIEHPAVVDVAVFGIPDDEWGESVKAAVELDEKFAPTPETELAILSFGRERLAGYKVPRSIDFEAKLPRQPTGKIYTRLLKEKYWSGRERNI